MTHIENAAELDLLMRFDDIKRGRSGRSAPGKRGDLVAAREVLMREVHIAPDQASLGHAGGRSSVNPTVLFKAYQLSPSFWHCLRFKPVHYCMAVLCHTRRSSRF